MNTTMLTMAALAAIVAAPAAAQDAKAGEKVFVACKTCHAVGAGQNRIGPSLAGIVGRKSGIYAKFTYSAAMKAKNVTWTEANLDTYLTKPQAYVKGTKMAYPGLPDAKKRKDLIAYLKTLKG
ncbi:MAG: c-type cytochrome [Sandarakinorhabdus sp.]